MPYKVMFPQMPNINDAPLIIWRINDGEFPFKYVFPEMHKIDAKSNIFMGNKKVNKFFIGDDKVLKIYLGDKLVMG